LPISPLRISLSIEKLCEKLYKIIALLAIGVLCYHLIQVSTVQGLIL